MLFNNCVNIEEKGILNECFNILEHTLGVYVTSKEDAFPRLTIKIDSAAQIKNLELTLHKVTYLSTSIIRPI